MSGRERASQFPGSHMRRFAAAVGTPDHGAPIRDRSRISRAAFGVGLLIALRVVGEGRSKRAAAEQERSGREGQGSIAKQGKSPCLWLRWRSRHVTPFGQVSSRRERASERGCRTRRTLPRAPIAAADLNRCFLRAVTSAHAPPARPRSKVTRSFCMSQCVCWRVPFKSLLPRRRIPCCRLVQMVDDTD